MRVACETANIRHSSRDAIDVRLSFSTSVTEIIPSFLVLSTIPKSHMRLRPESPGTRYSPTASVVIKPELFLEKDLTSVPICLSYQNFLLKKSY